ncbi:MAG: RNA polymerase sigma factor [Bacteroidota bacterium]
MKPSVNTRSKYIRFAESILNKLQDAEDVVQDCYIKMLERNKEEVLQNEEAYMMRMVRNACLDVLRKKKPEELEESYASLKLAQTDIHRQLEAKEQVQRLKILMNLLSEKQRSVFFLRDIEGYELAEIESMTGMNNEAVRTNLSRARKQLRELYNKVL